MKLFRPYLPLIAFLAAFLPNNLTCARTDKPVAVSLERIRELSEVGRLNPTPITEISAVQIADIDGDGFDEIACKCGDIIDFNTFSGQKLRRLWFPFRLHGWNVVNMEDYGGCCLLIFKEADGCARLEIYDTTKQLLGSMNLCAVEDWDGSGRLDFGMMALDMVDFDGNDEAELIIRSSAGYDLYPRGLFIIDPRRWRIIRENRTAGNLRNIHFTDIDADNLPDILISTHAPSNDAIVGDWDDSESVLMGIRGFDGSVLWRRVIGGPLSYVHHRLIDLDGDGGEEILTAEYSEFAGKEHNTILKVFKLPGGVEVRGWECSNPNTMMDCFTAWGSGKTSRILVGFDDGSLFKFDSELIPSPLYRFPVRISFVRGIDLDGDGQEEALVGLKDEDVVILDHKLRLVGRQRFSGPPVPIRTPEIEFGEFVVISEGRVFGWSIGGVKLILPTSALEAWLRQWGLYAGILVILLAAGGWAFGRSIRRRTIEVEGKTGRETFAAITDFADKVLIDKGGEDVRKLICNEILSKSDGKDTFDYLVFLLGDVEVYDGSGEVRISQWRGVKWKALFCYLVANRTRRIHKEKLLDLFWQDSKPKQGAQNLRLAVHHLNREISLPAKGRVVAYSDQCYSINPEYRLFIDAEEFERLISLADRLMKEGGSDQAIEYFLKAIWLYKDDYLMNLYESWCDVPRGYIQKLYIHAQKQVGRYLLNKNMSDKAVSYFRNALKIDEYSEELYIDIMRCHAASGNQKAVKEAYQHLLKLLHEEMDSEPLPETKRIYQSLIS